MKTVYLTLIVRLRMGEDDAREFAAEKVSGSLQQVGLQDIVYFDSVEKLQIAMQDLIDRMAQSSQVEGINRGPSESSST